MELDHSEVLSVCQKDRRLKYQSDITWQDLVVSQIYSLTRSWPGIRLYNSFHGRHSLCVSNRERAKTEHHSQETRIP